VIVVVVVVFFLTLPGDRFEYPLELDMKRYMSADAEPYEDEYYQYTLVGVIVHSGDAESGHYYSFIQV
jgi:ubiquitin C-terminal hydrolase